MLRLIEDEHLSLRTTGRASRQSAKSSARDETRKKEGRREFRFGNNTCLCPRPCCESNGPARHRAFRHPAVVLARWRASLGSTAANACLIGLLLLPVSALVLPTIMLDWLPARAGTRPETRSAAVTNSVPARSLRATPRSRWTTCRFLIDRRSRRRLPRERSPARTRYPLQASCPLQ